MVAHRPCRVAASAKRLPIEPSEMFRGLRPTSLAIVVCESASGEFPTLYLKLFELAIRKSFRGYGFVIKTTA